MANKHKGETVGIGTLIVVVLLILKLTGTCCISWIVVFAPWLFGLALLAFCAVIMGVIAIAAILTD